jgi:hypothetical protein
MRCLMLVIAIVACARVGSADSQSTASAQRFENFLFSPPPGWARSEDAEGLLLTSPDGQASIRFLRGVNVSMGLQQWMYGQFTQREQGLRLLNAEEPQTRVTGDDYEWIVWSRALSDTQGRIMARVYFAADPRGRAELIVFDALGSDAFGRHRSAVARLVDSVQFANVLGLPKPRPQPLPPVPVPLLKDVSGRNQFTSEPIPDQFSCYIRQMSDDYTTPDFFLQILPGRQYRIAAGTGSFDIRRNAEGTGELRFQSGPLATEPGGQVSRGLVSLSEQGQLIDLIDAPVPPSGVRKRVFCYQRGTREALAKTELERLDPRPGSYPCLTKYAKDVAGTLEILPGRRYRYRGLEGAYSVDILSAQLSPSRLSTLAFFGGPLGGGSGSYGLDAAGRQSYSVSARESLDCTR